MKRITLSALDYGLAFGVNKTLRELMQQGRLTAIGCLVGGDLWSREYKPLKDLADQMGSKALVGLNVALCGDRVRPQSERMLKTYGPILPSRSKIERRALLRLLPDELLIEETCAQIEVFRDRMEREPDFVAVRHGLLDRTAVTDILFAALEAAGLSGKPGIVAATNTGKAARYLRRKARENGNDLLPWGPPIPPISDPEMLLGSLWHHFDELDDRTFIACRPGEVDDRLRREESQDELAIRESHREVLSSDRFFQLLDDRDIFLN